MRISSLCIQNFKNYYGENDIDFTIEENKNLLVFGAKNGHGKTTLCEAIRLCLFGKKVFGYPMSSTEYDQYLVDSTNSQSKKENDSMSIINLELDMDESFGNYQLIITREWKCHNGSVRDSHLTIYRDGKRFQYIPEEYWQDFLESILPPYLADFFIFDGERVEDFAISKDMNSNLKESLKDIVGLKSYNTLKTDLTKLVSKIKRRNISEQSVRLRISELNDDLAAKNKELKGIQNSLDSIGNRLSNSLKIEKEKEKELERIAGKLSHEMESNNKELNTLNAHRSEINNYISQMSESFLPFAMPKIVKNSLLEQLKIEKDIKVKESSKEFLNHINGQFYQRLEKQLDNEGKFTKKHYRQIKAGVKITFSDFLQERSDEATVIHDLTKNEIEKIEMFFNVVDKEVDNGFKDKLTNLKKIENKITRIQKKIKKSSGGKEVKNLIDEISKIKSELKFDLGKLDKLGIKKNILENEKSNLIKSIRKLENKIICSEVDSRKIKLINNTLNAIDEIEQKVINSRFDKLENYISDMYYKLANKDDMVNKILINKSNYSIELYDYDSNIIKQDALSTGEKEILGLSVLWGFIKLSKYNFPVLIDAPLTSLDEDHVENILKQFLPNLSDQIIIFSTNREIKDQEFNLIKNKIYRMFEIKKDGPKKVKEVYFGG